MSEREPMNRGNASSDAGADPREERLRALYTGAYEPVSPSESLRARVETITAGAVPPPAARAPAPRRTGPWQRQPVSWPAMGAAGAAVLAIGMSFSLAWLHRGRTLGRPPEMIRDGAPIHGNLTKRPPSATHREERAPQIVATTDVPPAKGKDGATPDVPARVVKSARPANRVSLPLSPRRSFSTASAQDDLYYVNGDQLERRPLWVHVPPDVWNRIEAHVRRHIQVGDDFVQIPFPRLASTSDAQVAAAVESYRREAAIVDPRLTREVDCAFKGTALSDVCNQLRSDSGIELTAGPSVADEKVTVFCEKMPLREVMRQLSRPFGYTWLRSGTPGQYRYELEQDLRSQLLEEELRNRDRDEALLDLQREIDRYRPYLSLSPDEALARAKTAAPEEKKLLEAYAGWGWGPLQLYARLSPQQQAALRAGQTISFSGDPDQVARDGVLPLAPELERGVLQSIRDVRVRRPGSPDPSGNQPGIGSAQNLPDGVPPAASPEAHGFVLLRIGHSELGQFTFDGGSGVTVGNNIIVRGLVRDTSGDNHGAGDQPLTGVAGHDGGLGQGVSPAVQDPKNEIANARLAQAPALRQRVTVAPIASCPPHGDHAGPAAGDQAAAEKRVTTADVLEALHRASGLPIVADSYTHLYSPTAVSVNGQSLFAALNHLADAMHMRWHKDDRWLQFRSVSYYDDRAKEVPNRLLSRWASARRQHDGLPLDDLIEMAQLSDAQLDSRFVAEGIEHCWGLAEWSLARNHEGRLHLRYLAQLTPAQRELALSAQGLPFSRLSPTQQQGLIAHLGDRLRSLDELAGATVRVEYTHPGSFRWPAVNMQRPSGAPNLFGLAQVCEPTRAAALAAARRLDAGVSEAQIAPTDLSLTVVYTLIEPRTGKAKELGVCEHADGALISRWASDQGVGG